MRLWPARSRLTRALLRLSVGALWLSVSAVAQADKVYLHTGSVLEGKVTREGDKVVVQLESGSIRLDAASVTRIEKAVTPLEQITRLRAALPAEGVAERIELANMCRAAQLTGCERELLEEVIARASDHAEARARLGYVRTETGWLSPAEQARRNEQNAERERAARAESESALAQASILRETAELARKQAELALQRERLALQKAELERSSEASRLFGYAAPFYGAYSLQLPKLSTPSAGPFIFNGVRAPSESGFNLSGVRSPASYFH